MRLALPTRIPLHRTLFFAGALFLVQQLQHTDFLFSLFFFAFVVLANITFNIAGGFNRASGAYVFFFAMLTCIIGVTWKAVVGEPADSNLMVPQLDMALYLVSMVMLLLIILLNKRLTGHSRGIAGPPADYSVAALGCLVLGVLQFLLNLFHFGGPGSALSAVNQLSQFLSLAMILGTIGAIRDSRGLRSINFINGLALAFTFIFGVIGFSKTAMLLPLLCWFVGAAYARLPMRWPHYIVCLLSLLFTFRIAPAIAAGRNQVREDTGTVQRIQIVYQILTQLLEGSPNEEANTTPSGDVAPVGHGSYFDQPQGFIERLSILSVDDTFIHYTTLGNSIGYRPIWETLENLVPHFLLPDKPYPIGGNFYAHEIGGFLADSDDSTGISFSPVSEAFHISGWVGITLLMPLIWLLLFVTADLIGGDLRRSPWPLLMTVVFAHAAAESLLSGLIGMIVYSSLSVVLAIVFCTQFAPIVGALFYGSPAPGPAAAALPPRRRPLPTG